MASTANTARRDRRPQDQRLEALRKANEIRARRAQLKRDLAAGAIHIHDVLAMPPNFAAAERVAVLLLALPGYGPARVAKLLQRTRIGESRRLAALTDRQRTELIQHL